MSVGLGKNKAPVKGVAYVPDQARIFACGAAQEISVWTANTLAFERMVPASNAPFQVMRFNRSGTYMFTGDSEGNVKYWESSLTAREDFRAHSEAVNGIECVAAARFCACASQPRPPPLPRSPPRPPPAAAAAASRRTTRST
jgi:WD40 repeat protein